MPPVSQNRIGRLCDRGRAGVVVVVVVVVDYPTGSAPRHDSHTDTTYRRPNAGEGTMVDDLVRAWRAEPEGERP